jgi:hypothetical protein
LLLGYHKAVTREEYTTRWGFSSHYWTSSNNSLELIELSSINKVSLV